ncbi:hypothetical protein GCM10017566_66700 [Amycolatopsis bartoniae]|uniref:Uncharacterized protein n=1 Tax=Amycolatopsis bartoniae TaxID=941986 RepID=A0A8H9J3Q9_9PSEU|nr:hypothetical protein GCM10017566_66700 [Amycolatopsis bartoniae]
MTDMMSDVGDAENSKPETGPDDRLVEQLVNRAEVGGQLSGGGLGAILTPMRNHETTLSPLQCRTPSSSCIRCLPVSRLPLKRCTYRRVCQNKCVSRGPDRVAGR